MKLLTLIRGAGLAGAGVLLHAQIAYGRPSANAFERTPLHLGSTVATHAASSSGAGGSIIRTVVGLAIVIAVIYGLAWLVRHLKADKKNQASGFGIEQVASLPLGTGKSVALVRVGTELHLLGISEQSVTTIRSFTEDEAIDFGLPVSAPGEQPAIATETGPPIVRAVETLRRLTVR